MQKIVTLFQRNYETDRLVRNEVTPGAEWVLAGEGVATRKLDGTCCLIRGGKLHKRYEVKRRGNARDGWAEFLNYPDGWEAAAPLDPETGKEQGWVPVGDGPEDRWHREALANLRDLLTIDAAFGGFPDGTYELCGPKVQGNPEGYARHVLMPHGEDELPDAPRDFDGLRAYLCGHDIEGIVWHHDDGRMVKLKKRDFGFKRGK